jgi:hypothetical protein
MDIFFSSMAMGTDEESDAGGRVNEMKMERKTGAQTKDIQN